MSYDNLKLKNQLCHPLYSASNALVRVYDPHLRALDLTYPQYLLMMSLWEEDKVNISHLSASTLFDSGSLTPLLRRLEKKGFIHIQTTKEDKRQKLIALTRKGEKLKLEACKIPELMQCQINLTVDESKTLKRLLEKLKTNLQSPS